MTINSYLASPPPLARGIMKSLCMVAVSRTSGMSGMLFSNSLVSK